MPRPAPRRGVSLDVPSKVVVRGGGRTTSGRPARRVTPVVPVVASAESLDGSEDSDDDGDSGGSDPNVWSMASHPKAAAGADDDDDDEEIDEETAFTAEDEAKWGESFPSKRKASKRARTGGVNSEEEEESDDDEGDGESEEEEEGDDDNDEEEADEEGTDDEGAASGGLFTPAQAANISKLIAALAPAENATDSKAAKAASRRGIPITEVNSTGDVDSEFQVGGGDRSGLKRTARGAAARAAAALLGADGVADSGAADLGALTASLEGTEGFGALKARLEALVGRALPAKGVKGGQPVAPTPLLPPPSDAVIALSSRAAAFAATAARVGGWTATVAQVRRAPHISFAAEAAQDTRAGASTAALASSFAPAVAFEAAVAAALGASGQGAVPGGAIARGGIRSGDMGVVAAEMNEAAGMVAGAGGGLGTAPAPTAAALAARTAALQRMRSLLFYDEVKKRRANRIKSKTFRRLRKRADTAAGKAAIAQLKTDDPEAAAALEAEEARVIARERVTLKHRAGGRGVGGSKWVKRVLSRSKSGHDAADMAEVQRRGEELKKRMAGHRSRDDGDERDEDDSGTDSGDDLGDDAARVLSKGAAKAREAAIDAQNAPAPPTKGLLGMKFMQVAAHTASQRASHPALELASKLGAMAARAKDGDAWDAEDARWAAEAGEEGGEEGECEEREGADAPPPSGRMSFAATAALVGGGAAPRVAGVKSRREADTPAPLIVTSDISGTVTATYADTAWLRQGGRAVYGAAPTAAESALSSAAAENPWLANSFSTGENKGGRHAASKRAAAAKSAGAGAGVIDAAAAFAALSDPTVEHHASAVGAGAPATASQQLGSAKSLRDIASEQVELVRRAFGGGSGAWDDHGAASLEADKATDSAADAAAAPKTIKRARTSGAEEILAPKGWGSWAGMGSETVNASETAREAVRDAKKAKRMARSGVSVAVSTTAAAARAAALRAPPPPPPRRDARLARVMLSERRDKGLATLQLPSLPPAYPSAAALEAATRVPIGSEWNAAGSAAALTRPAWTTRVGTIIDPIKVAHAPKGAPEKEVRAGVPALTMGKGARKVR